MKVALVHDTLTELGGAERVLFALKELYPHADIYTSFFSPEKFGEWGKAMQTWNIHTSFANKSTFIKKYYSPLRFITPYIWESFDFTGYDLVISSSGSYMSKGVITRPETLHVCYLHHQPRYLYYYETGTDWQKYAPVRAYAHYINHGLRMWDYLASQRPDIIVTNAQEVRDRCRKFYRRDAQVVYPPVDIAENSTIPEGEGAYYLSVCRLERAKHVELLVQAANMYQLPLIIVGSGKQEEYLKSIAGPTVTFKGKVSDEERNALFTYAKAFVNASVDEDFGIANVEAMGRGVPVIAYNSGGHKETIVAGKTGFLFGYHTAESLHESVVAFETLTKKELADMRKAARDRAREFSKDRFKKEFDQVVKKHLSAIHHHHSARTVSQ